MKFWTEVWIKVALKHARIIRDQAGAIEGVRALHYQYPDTFDCAHCGHDSPCPTIQRLDGEQG